MIIAICTVGSLQLGYLLPELRQQLGTLDQMWFFTAKDRLKGRLHAADRLVDILLSAVPEARSIDGFTFKVKLFQSILRSEKPHLIQSAELLAQLGQEVAALQTPNSPTRGDH